MKYIVSFFKRVKEREAEKLMAVGGKSPVISERDLTCSYCGRKGSGLPVLMPSASESLWRGQWPLLLGYYFPCRTD